MNKTRRIGAIVAASMAAAGMTMTVLSAPAAAAPRPNDGPRPLSQYLGSFDERDTEAVRVAFRSNERICNFKLWVRDARNVDVSNPRNRPFTSLNRDSQLNRGEVDFASFWVRTGEIRGNAQNVVLPATISYDNCSRRARIQTKSTGFLLTIREDRRGGGMGQGQGNGNHHGGGDHHGGGNNHGGGDHHGGPNR